MNVQVNMWGVVLAMVAAFVTGGIWYNSVLGKKWAKLSGTTIDAMNKKFPQKALILLVATFLTAYVLAHVAYLSNQFFHDSFLKDSVQTAFWLWLGISATTLVAHDSFSDKPAKLTWLNIANRLVTLLIMGWVIGLAGIK